MLRPAKSKLRSNGWRSPTNNQRGRRSGPCRLWGGLDKARYKVPTALLVRVQCFRMSVQCCKRAKHKTSTVIPRKTEFSENCLSPRQQSDIEKNEIWTQMLKVGRDTLMRSMKTFQLVQKGFLGSQINLNLPNVMKNPCRPTKCVYGSHLKYVLCAEHKKWTCVINIECLLITIVKSSFKIKEHFL